ncbi:effector-associated constant component EACC1 [Streptomyces cyaneofuscatus]|uniref:effector-associated constant component EACC1 n=1 Tax=Streptomyces cyaneofuscatus TaxID=66883 RepID=UPI0036DF94C7
MPETISAHHPEGAGAPFEAVLTVSQPADAGPLFRRLRAIPELTVTRSRSAPADGELGVAEVVQLLVPSSAVLAVAIRTLPVFIRSRRSSVTVKVEVGKRSVTVTGDNLDDPEKVLEIVDRLLGDD